MPGPLLLAKGVGTPSATALLLSLPLGPGRSNIALHVSMDGGNTWGSPKQLDTGYGGYSGLVQMGNVDGTRAVVGVAYEAGPEPDMNCTDACSVRFMPVVVG